MIRLLCIAGARPNFVKIAPLHRAFSAHPGLESRIVHTGQHYDRRMSDLFFEQLGLPEPDLHLGVGSGSHARQTAAVMEALEPVLMEDRPDAVVVVGDVNSTLAAALTAVKLHIPVAHVEAGLRSGDRGMPEEINRLATDAISDLCYVSEPSGMAHLRAEGVPESRIVFAGNVMIDSLVAIREQARVVGQAKAMGLSGPFALVTLHRPATVDQADTLARAVDYLEELAASLPIVMPMHPRTRGCLESHGLLERLQAISGILVASPMGYLEFMSLMLDAALVFTDSGGIQEETTFLGIPCLTMRPSTERPVTVTEGTNELFPLGSTGLTEKARAVLSGRWKAGRIPEGWDGKAAERIAAHLAETLG
ncbi:MAG: UDP-N-acetylglucosamine 2-epimerase (non-hydrolyzing) [Rhodothermales bacterium]|nr:UDP-N-acetylglucosamine 2-epimerase (non-hydrolyzing) [Rhodothermales bacterium]MBO6779605.1 UDP-N-acetylglucosamine 2-epimerase (non-hydrolyzing) [Rhodothermales bacterium]